MQIEGSHCRISALLIPDWLKAIFLADVPNKSAVRKGIGNTYFHNYTKDKVLLHGHRVHNSQMFPTYLSSTHTSVDLEYSCTSSRIVLY